MVIPFQIGGARVVIPGVYDVLRVQSSLPAPVPAGRSILVLGESEAGVPGSQLDLRLNYFTDFNSVRDYYKAGPVVDAARMAFSAQPSNVFGGAIQRLYVWKTNQTTRASKTIASPAGYGAIVAAKYGEDGNMIKSQIKGLSEVKPSKTFSYLPSPDAQTFTVVVNGKPHTVAMDAIDLATGKGCPSQFATKVAAVSGVHASAAPKKSCVATDVDGAVASSAGSDVITIAATAGAFDVTSVAVGDVAVIPAGSILAGAGNKFAGVYTVVAWAAASVSLKQVKQFGATTEDNAAVFGAPLAVTGVTNDDIAAFAPITVEVTETTKTGTGSTLEIATVGGSVVAPRNVCNVAGFVDVIRSEDVGIASVSASVSGNRVTVSIDQTTAGWSVVPKAGDNVKVGRNSAVAGASKENVGVYVVVSATAKTMTLQTISDITPAAVSATVVTADSVEWVAGIASSSVAPKKIESASEAQVWIEATDTKNNVSFPTTKVGGTTFFEVGFYDGVATSCSVSIDAQRTMTIVAGSSTLTIKTGKYKNLQQMADFVNTKAGLYAKVPNALHKTLPTSVLDAVDSADACGAFSAQSTNCKIKGDYYSFKKFVDDNFGLIAFQAGAMVLKSGLPTPEASASFLSGAVVGGTSDADIQQGLDQSLKIDVRNVVPCFSRDALEDVADGITDSSSTYSIDSINAAVKAHVATASTTKEQRYRFGCVSVHSSFETAKAKCAELGYERLQMAFEQYSAINGDGAIAWFLPWMGALAVATGRSQAALGTSMLRKPFAVSAVKHVGQKSLYDDTLVQDFDPENKAQVEEAITAGLLVHRAVTGFGVRLESPDLSTRSRENDPEGWVWERVNVLFTLDEVRTTLQSVLDNRIGARQSDVTTATVQEDCNSALRPFVAGGSIVAYKVNSVVKEGTGYRVNVSVKPTEALEFIGVEITAERAS